MNLQARRISGSTFTAEDKLEVRFDSDNQLIESVVHTIGLVSGINVTHGGGAQPGEYLHYKAIERDADDNGVIDYSDVEMALVQESQGVSVIKVMCQIFTKENADNFNTECQEWAARRDLAFESNSAFTEEAPSPVFNFIETANINLAFTTDGFV